MPQGSVLGPLLFVLYINDLPECIESDSYLFADDTKIFQTITSKEEADLLQSDIDSLQLWSDKWLLKFHPDKCHVLSIGKFEDIAYTKRYQLGGTELEHVFSEKDLGVIIDSELTFEEHINAKIQKANIMSGLIRRSFSFLDGKLFKKLYVAFVRPHLEYCQAVWAPHLKKYINSIENVQRRATKSVDGMNNLDYVERLHRLEIPTLAFRRLRGDMIEMYKHFHSYDRTSLSQAFRPREEPSRRHNFQLHRNFSKGGYRSAQHNSFYYRSVKTWNELPKDVGNAESINMFKNKLDELWKNHPLRYNFEALY